MYNATSVVKWDNINVNAGGMGTKETLTTRETPTGRGSTVRDSA